MKRDGTDIDGRQVREMDRLLRLYATDVFDPRDEELDDVSDEQVQTLMRKTAFMRWCGARLSLSTVRRLSVAAMLMIGCGVFMHIALRENALPPAVGVVPQSVTRAGAHEVKVCSPNGATRNRMPDIVITGDADTTYRVSIKNMDGELVVPEIEMKGGTTLQGSKCFPKPLERDEVYSIVVKRDGNTVNDVGNSSFWIEAD